MADDDLRRSVDLLVSHREIEQLIYRMGYHLETGDFVQVGELLRHATFGADKIGRKVFRGADEITAQYQRTNIVYPEGGRRTKEIYTNVLISIDLDADTATSVTSFTVAQQVPGGAVRAPGRRPLRGRVAARRRRLAMERPLHRDPVPQRPRPPHAQRIAALQLTALLSESERNGCSERRQTAVNQVAARPVLAERTFLSDGDNYRLVCTGNIYSRRGGGGDAVGHVRDRRDRQHRVHAGHRPIHAGAATRGVPARPRRRRAVGRRRRRGLPERGRRAVRRGVRDEPRAAQPALQHHRAHRRREPRRVGPERVHGDRRRDRFVRAHPRRPQRLLVGAGLHRRHSPGRAHADHARVRAAVRQPRRRPVVRPGGAAPHVRVRHHQRAARPRRRHVPPARQPQPAGAHARQADDARRPPELADDLEPVPAVRLLARVRRRRSDRDHERRPRPRPRPTAGHHRRRGRGALLPVDVADPEAGHGDGAGVAGSGAARVADGGHHDRRHRHLDDPRGVHLVRAGSARGARDRGARRGRAVRGGRPHPPRRAAARQHPRRRALRGPRLGHEPRDRGGPPTPGGGARERQVPDCGHAVVVTEGNFFEGAVMVLRG